MKYLNRRNIGRILGASIVSSIIAVSAMGSVALAQNYPNKTIKLIIPFGAGGGSDVLVRTLQPTLEKYLGVDLVIVNVPGAGSVTGSRRVLDAKPDGYEVLVNHTTLLTAMAVGKADFNTDGFAVIASAAAMPLVIAVPKNAPENSLKDLITAAKDKGKPTIAGVNIGAINHFAMGMIQSAVNGQEYRYVQTGGGAKTTAALLGNHINVGVLGAPEALPLLESGDVKLVAALSDVRIPYLPDLPTAKEQGANVSIGIEYTWYMPAGAPQEALDKFSKALEATMNDPKIKALLDKRGVKPSFSPASDASKRVKVMLSELRVIAAGMKLK